MSPDAAHQGGPVAPTGDRRPVAVIGVGRLGSALAVAMSRAGYRVVSVSTRRPDNAAQLKTQLPDALVTASPAECAARGDIVFIATSDNAVAEVCRGIKWRKGQWAVHCAGAVGLDVLAPAEASGCAIGGIHPLQTFAGGPSPHAFTGISFAVEAPDSALRDWLFGLARDLGGTPFEIRAEQRALYHASAVMASGMLAGLVGLAAQTWAGMGLSRGNALHALLPLVETTLANLREKGLPAAITGPYVRGDLASIQSHLAAMQSQSPDLERAYSALALAELPLAQEQGRLTLEQRDAIERILRSSLESRGSPKSTKPVRPSEDRS